MANAMKVFARPQPTVASDHTVMNQNRASRGPMRSTSQPVAM